MFRWRPFSASASEETYADRRDKKLRGFIVSQRRARCTEGNDELTDEERAIATDGMMLYEGKKSRNGQSIVSSFVFEVRAIDPSVILLSIREKITGLFFDRAANIGPTTVSETLV